MISRFFFINSSFSWFYIISVSGDCKDFTFKTLSNCNRHNYDLSISRYEKSLCDFTNFLQAAFSFLYHFDIISVSGDWMHFTFEKLIKFLQAEVWSINFTIFFWFLFSQFHQFEKHSLSKTCQIVAGTSMIRQFHDFFWLDFWYSAQLFGVAAAVARSASTHKLSLLVG